MATGHGKGAVGEAGRPWLDWLLGKIGMTNEEAGAMAMPLFYDKARDVIRRPNQSGFRDVFKIGHKWQAKPYTGPKDQRHAGYFATPGAAADEVLKYLCTGVCRRPSRSESAGREVRPRGRQRRGRRRRSRPLPPHLWRSCLLSRSRLRPLLSLVCTPLRATMARRRERRPWSRALWTPYSVCM